MPADGRGGVRESKVRVRAHFDYIATTDPFIPCKEAGLDFFKGDILHIVSQDDAYWSALLANKNLYLLIRLNLIHYIDILKCICLQEMITLSTNKPTHYTALNLNATLTTKMILMNL